MKKRNIFTFVQCILAGLFLVGAVSSANAGIDVTLASTSTTYTAGTNNTITFNVGLTYTNFEWVDQYSFSFPAGVTVVSGTPASGAGFCGGNNGVQVIAGNTIQWSSAGYVNTGSGCGTWQAATSSFTIVINPGAYTGPMVVTLTSKGDGYPSPYTDFETETDNITLAQFVPPVPCNIVCPGNITVNLDPGACSQVVNYDVHTTGDCFIGGVTSNFVGAYAPSAINYYQYDAGIFTNPPTPFSNGYAVAFNSPTNSTLTLKSTDFGYSPGPNLYYFNGVEWTNTTGSSQNVSFNWNYTTIDGAFYDRFYYKIGTAASNFANSNFGNQTGLWTLVTNTAGGTTQNGAVNIVIPAGGRLALAAYTTDAGFGPCTITISNFAVSSVLPALPVQTAGLPSGSEFPIGTTHNCWQVTANNVTTGAVETKSCCFDVIVNEYPNPISTLVCNDLVNISLDESCVHCIGADEVLEGGPYGCYDDYIVQLDKTLPLGNGPWIAGCLSAADINKTYAVRVTDPTTGNSCWGQVHVEDKIKPIVLCEDLDLPCNAPSTADAATAYFFAAGTGNVPVSIIDNQTVTATMNISGLPADAKILDANVIVDINHTWIGDLDITLTSPQGVEMHIWDNLCGATDNFKATFDDQDPDCYNPCANYTAGDTIQPFPCLFAQFGAFADGDWCSVFTGAALNGQWTLTVNDNATGDQGTINNFGLKVKYYSASLVYQPDVIENCGSYTLSSTDVVTNGGCAQGYTQQIKRKWTATDASGNTGTCVQTINFILPTIDNLLLPPDYDNVDEPAFVCGGVYPTPNWIEGQGLQGYPYVFGEPDGCTISWTYHDVTIDVCDGTYKILRKWDVVDWCAGEAYEHNQIVKVMDNVGPSLACPANITVSTDPFQCCATVNLPDVIISDACSQINNISWMVIGIDPYTNDTIGMFTGGGSLTSFPGNNLWNPDTLGQYGWTPCLPLGTHTVVYSAEDDCGNISTCSFRLTVRDYTPPVAACDEYTVVAIGIDDPFDCYGPAGPSGTPAALDACEFAGVTWVKATTFDDGSYDNCGNIKFTVRRMAPYSDCINALNSTNGHPACDDFLPDFPSEFERAISEGDSVKFYCCEVGTTQTVILSVYETDVNGNFVIGPDGSPVKNECMVQIEVQDKIKPVCTPPAHVTVSCEDFDPSLWAYGKASVYDNCCLDVTKEYQGQCGLTHSVNYSQFDTLCNKGTIVRTFRAFDCHGFSSQCTQRVVVNYVQDYYVKFPNDAIVTTCNGSGNYGAPTFFGEDCELLGVSFQDEVFTVVPDACYKIERTWTIINWCTYNPNLPCINVPNPNPNAITNHPSNLPGPTVSAAGTPNPWNPTIVKINPTDAQATNYSTFWDANANCYKYKQIIKIIDTEDPLFANCPASPVEICDYTANDPLFWNDMAYWDNTIGSHDLCEAPSDLCVTVTDSCGGANVNVRYLLFLDMNGDGTMETQISSTNPPAPNTIPYLGGTPFDNRPVPANQKYRFNIDWTTSGNARTACVRWDNLQTPANLNDNVLQGVTPQLPYGTHKIKWIAEDGCGNEAICEYTFVVKDCKKPTVVCINGLSVNIMPTGMITLWASDFLQYTDDNCTPANQIKIGIVESDQSTGSFPVDGNGNPLTSVTFDCSELGPQYVQLWGQDAAGNADFCETYVLVQDNANNCSANPISVAGALKTEATNGLEEANVQLNGSHPALPPVSMFDMTDNAGAYNFSQALPIAANYTVTPLKDDNHLNGVTTYDLVLISKHILGLEPLNTPYKMIAADANKSNSITTFDIVELRKLILGIYSELPNNTSWRFVDKGYNFADPSNPFAAQFPEFLTVAQVQQSNMDDDFVAVKVGDVNGSAIANSFMSADDRTAGTLLFDVEDRTVKAGEEFTVNFKAAEQVLGYQFTMNYNNLEVVDVLPGADMSADNFGVFADAITTSFDGKQAGEFAVKFRAKADGNLSNMIGVSSRITKAEAYNNGNRLEVAFRFNGTTIAGVGFELYQNTPNPFVNKTMIGFHLPEATQATLSIYDETGRVIYTQQGDFAKGYNAITIDRAVLNTTGMLYYKLETATESATRKMIQTK